MKHNDDEALYQQILAELKPGADEYDQMVAQRKHSAAWKHRLRPYYGYVAAACVMIAVLVTTQVLWQTDRLPRTPQIAHQVVPTTKMAVTRVVAQKDVPADMPAHVPAKEQRHQQRLTAKTVTPIKIEKVAKDSACEKRTFQTEVDRAARVAEVELRVMEALLEQQVALEVVDEAIKQNENVKRIQCSI